MTNFIERIKSYSKRKDAADMAIRAWKSDNKKVYADFCKRMDAVAKGNMSVLMDMYLMMRDCVPPSESECRRSPCATRAGRFCPKSYIPL